MPVRPAPLPENDPALLTLPAPSILNFSTALFWPLRILPPAALLNTAAVPLGLLTCELTPIVLPDEALARPRMPVPEVLEELPLMP